MDEILKAVTADESRARGTTRFLFVFPTDSEEKEWTALYCLVSGSYTHEEEEKEEKVAFITKNWEIFAATITKIIS